MARSAFTVIVFCWLVACSALALMMLVFHLFKLIQNDGFRGANQLSSILSLVLIAQTIIGIAVFAVTGMIEEENHDHWFCVFAAKWSPSGYLLFKFNMYCILVIRLHQTFKKSSFRYEARNLKLWVAILLTWTLTNAVIFLLTVDNITGECAAASTPIPLVASVVNLGILHACLYYCKIAGSMMNRPRGMCGEHRLVRAPSAQAAP